jgi:hypothetical protein
MACSNCSDNCKCNCSCNCTESIDVCGCCKYSAEDVAYVGPTLECTGVENCDPLPEALVKIDEYICGLDLVQNVINYITNNVEIYQQFVTIVNNSINCETVADCITTTTTTTCECSTYTFEIGPTVGAQQVAYFPCGGNQNAPVILDVEEEGIVYEVCARNDQGMAVGWKVDVTKLDCCPTTTTTTTAIPTTTTTTTV